MMAIANKKLKNQQQSQMRDIWYGNCVQLNFGKNSVYLLLSVILKLFYPRNYNQCLNQLYYAIEKNLESVIFL